MTTTNQRDPHAYLAGQADHYAQLPSSLWPGGRRATSEEAITPYGVQAILDISLSNPQSAALVSVRLILAGNGPSNPQSAALVSVRLILAGNGPSVIADVHPDHGQVAASAGPDTRSTAPLNPDTATQVFHHYAQQLAAQPLSLKVPH